MCMSVEGIIHKVVYELWKKDVGVAHALLNS